MPWAWTLWTRAPTGKVLSLQMDRFPPLPIKILSCLEGNREILQGDYSSRWPRTVCLMSECPNIFINNAPLHLSKCPCWDDKLYSREWSSARSSAKRRGSDSRTWEEDEERLGYEGEIPQERRTWGLRKLLFSLVFKAGLVCAELWGRWYVCPVLQYVTLLPASFPWRHPRYLHLKSIGKCSPMRTI